MKDLIILYILYLVFFSGITRADFYKLFRKLNIPPVEITDEMLDYVNDDNNFPPGMTDDAKIFATLLIFY